MKISQEKFGTAMDGRDIILYTITNDKGMSASVMNLGAILVRLLVPDARGQAADVVLGFDKGEDYYTNPSFFGAVIGPNANRIGGAAFTLDGVRYQLDVNDNENNLHSHFTEGYHAQLWDAETLEDGVRFTLYDTDGHMGFPGNKTIDVTYRLDEENGLALHYHGTSDRRTPLNLTNHSYFNLDGNSAGKIEDHTLRLYAPRYTLVAAGAIPTGSIARVEDTPLDFTAEKPIGRDINEPFKQLELVGGYDHNFLIDGWDGTLRLAATVTAPVSGRVMDVYTTLPGIQFYAGNFIDRQSGKGGAVYDKRSGLALESQYYPDTVNHDNFPSCVFGAGKDYDSETVYRFR